MRLITMPRSVVRTAVLIAAIATTLSLDVGHAQDPPQWDPTIGLRGRHRLTIDSGDDGVLFVPAGYKRGVPLPVLVWLHGAGGSGDVSAGLAALADEFSFLVLAPQAHEWTWDAILGHWDVDVDLIQRALQQTLSRYTIDRSRIWLGGFSDGGSYALSLGISYGDVFKKIYAGAPGVMQPIAKNGMPAIFISHGLDDQTMPIDITSRRFVPKLQSLGYDVTYKEHEGRHQLPPEILREVIEWLNAKRP